MRLSLNQGFVELFLFGIQMDIAPHCAGRWSAEK